MTENLYLTALNGMKEIIPDTERTPSLFNRKQYTESFFAYYEQKISVYEAVETGYQNAIDKEQYIRNMAEAVVESGVAEIGAVNKKSKQNLKMIDVNLCLVAYVLPGIMKYGGGSAKVLADEISNLWKEKYPKTNLMAGSYEDIEAGFHRKFCYITTAVCETLGKPDHCYELDLLRKYRDGYLQNQPDGADLIRSYYDVAPTIVKRINKQSDKDEIYRNLWESYISPCISMIEHNENESCQNLYMKMVQDLQEIYFYTQS